MTGRRGLGWKSFIPVLRSCPVGQPGAEGRASSGAGAFGTTGFRHARIPWAAPPQSRPGGGPRPRVCGADAGPGASGLAPVQGPVVGWTSGPGRPVGGSQVRPRGRGPLRAHGLGIGRMRFPVWPREGAPALPERSAVRQLEATATPSNAASRSLVLGPAAELGAPSRPSGSRPACSRTAGRSRRCCCGSGRGSRPRTARCPLGRRDHPVARRARGVRGGWCAEEARTGVEAPGGRSDLSACDAGREAGRVGWSRDAGSAGAVGVAGAQLHPRLTWSGARPPTADPAPGCRRRDGGAGPPRAGGGEPQNPRGPRGSRPPPALPTAHPQDARSRPAAWGARVEAGAAERRRGDGAAPSG